MATTKYVWVKMLKRSAGASKTRKWNWKKGSVHRVSKREADAMIKDRAAEICDPPESAKDTPSGATREEEPGATREEEHGDSPEGE